MGKLNYKWPFSIAMLNYQRVSVGSELPSKWRAGTSEAARPIVGDSPGGSLALSTGPGAPAPSNSCDMCLVRVSQQKP